MSDKGFLSRFTWREYFLVGGLLIIWAIVAFTAFASLGEADMVTTGFALFIGAIATGILLIIIAIIERLF